MSMLGGITTERTGRLSLRRYLFGRRLGVEGLGGVIGSAAFSSTLNTSSFVGTGISYPCLGVFCVFTFLPFML